jgi:hypothetical protein
MSYVNPFLHKFSNINFKNFMLIRFKRIEANYFVCLSNKFHLENYSYEFFFTFHHDMKPCDTKRQVLTQKKK